MTEIRYFGTVRLLRPKQNKVLYVNMENMDLLPPTAPSLVFARETCTPYYNGTAYTPVLTNCAEVTDSMNGYKVNQLFVSEKVLDELHDRVRHQGIDRVETLVRAKLYWPNIRAYIHNWTAKCASCNLAKMPHFKVRTPMYSIGARHPLEVVAIDFTVFGPASNRIEKVLVMTDVYSKFTTTVPTRNQTAQTMAKALVGEWFLHYGDTLSDILS